MCGSLPRHFQYLVVFFFGRGVGRLNSSCKRNLIAILICFVEYYFFSFVLSFLHRNKHELNLTSNRISIDMSQWIARWDNWMYVSLKHYVPCSCAKLHCLWLMWEIASGKMRRYETALYWECLSLNPFRQLSFSHSHKVGNVCIIANFVFPYIWSFLICLQQMLWVNVKKEIKEYMRIIIQGYVLYWNSWFLMAELKRSWQCWYSCIVDSLWKILMHVSVYT